MNDSTLSNMDGDLNSDTFPLCCWLFSTRFLISVFHLRVGSLLSELVLHPPFLALSCARIWGVRAGGRESSPNKIYLGLNSKVTFGTEDIKSPWLVEKNYQLKFIWPVVGVAGADCGMETVLARLASLLFGVDDIEVEDLLFRNTGLAPVNDWLLFSFADAEGAAFLLLELLGVSSNFFAFSLVSLRWTKGIQF